MCKVKCYQIFIILPEFRTSVTDRRRRHHHLLGSLEVVACECFKVDRKRFMLSTYPRLAEVMLGLGQTIALQGKADGKKTVIVDHMT